MRRNPCQVLPLSDRLEIEDMHGPRRMQVLVAALYSQGSPVFTTRLLGAWLFVGRESWRASAAESLREERGGFSLLF
jgi:hypothetical protein